MFDDLAQSSTNYKHDLKSMLDINQIAILTTSNRRAFRSRSSFMDDLHSMPVLRESV